MNRQDPTQVQQVAVIGTGVIGSGWAAHFLRNGMDVVAFDPAPDAEAKLRRRIDAVWPILERLGLKAGAKPERLRFVDDLKTAVSHAHFIQENAPEREQLKIDLISQIDAAAPPQTVIASSTSGYPMTLLAQNCRHPERCIVAHPFNPPYIIPVVELVAGEKTSVETVDWLFDFYTATGKKPLRCSKEIPGFVADRLMEAIWREALHMLDNEMATVAEIDAAIRYGPGLRWAIMGPLTVLHLAGGEGGMRHMLQQFGPSLKAPWTFLEAPELTEALRQRVIEGCEALTAVHPIKSLEQERDALLIGIIELLQKSSIWNL
jgi:carnitine 3-dehydrogenase